MGMGAPKPRSTLPPQGGKGGVRPTQPGVEGKPAPQYGPGSAGPGAPPSAFLAEKYAEMERMRAGQPQQPGQVPAQGGKGNMPLPADYQSRYGNYGFDSGLQNYLDQQYVGSTRDAGVGYQYDPSTQTFTGGTRTGQYNPIPLNVMQQAAGGNREVLSPYFQSRFPQTATQPQRDLGYGNPPPRPRVMPRPVPQVMPRQPTPKPAPQGIAGISQRINQMRQRGRR